MALDLELTIPHPLALVWDTVTDFRTAPYWLGLENLRPMEKDAPIGRGTRLVYDARGAAHASTITRFEPRKFFTLSAQQGGIVVDYAYVFEAVGDRKSGETRVRLHAECAARGWFWKLILPFVSRAMEKGDREQLTALAKVVDAVAKTEALQKSKGDGRG